MKLRELHKVGHWPTLLGAFSYFDISFMIWMLVGALANAIALEFPLSSLEKGLLVGTPILGGAVLRLVLGVMADRMGARRTAILGMVLTSVPLLLGWLWADSFDKILVVGLLLGVAGGSFAVAVPLAGRWYPREQQGLVLGIAGAGNSGTCLAVFLGPWLAEQVGWHMVFGVALIPLAIVLVLFALFVEESPHQPPPKAVSEYLGVLRLGDTWALSLLYGLTFGGFVGLASFLSLFFHDHYGVSPVAAGALVGICVVAGSFLRPLGGYLADRFGGIFLLTVVYAGGIVILLDLSTSPPLVWGTILFVTLLALFGIGNGAVFQLVPQRFPKEIGVVTGVVGAMGSVGGFLLPTCFVGVHELTGSYAVGFLALASMALCCIALLFRMRKSWDGVFVTKEGLAARMTQSVPSTRLEPEMAGSRGGYFPAPMPSLLEKS